MFTPKEVTAELSPLLVLTYTYFDSVFNVGILFFTEKTILLIKEVNLRFSYNKYTLFIYTIVKWSSRGTRIS